MGDRGTVVRDGFRLDWIREGVGIPMMVLGALRFYRRYFPSSLRQHFEIVFCDLRQWCPRLLGSTSQRLPVTRCRAMLKRSEPPLVSIARSWSAATTGSIRVPSSVVDMGYVPGLSTRVRQLRRRLTRKPTAQIAAAP